MIFEKPLKRARAESSKDVDLAQPVTSLGGEWRGFDAFLAFLPSGALLSLTNHLVAVSAAVPKTEELP